MRTDIARINQRFDERQQRIRARYARIMAALETCSENSMSDLETLSATQLARLQELASSPKAQDADQVAELTDQYIITQKKIALLKDIPSLETTLARYYQALATDRDMELTTNDAIRAAKISAQV